MELDVIHNGQTVRFIVAGDIDEIGAQELKTQFEALQLDAVREGALDFGGVTRIGSAGLGKLLLFYKKLASLGEDLRIANARQDIKDLLIELNLNTLFTVT